MFTICYVVYASLVSNENAQWACHINQTQHDLSAAVAMCEAIDHDPIRTCSMKSLGAHKWVVAARSMELGSTPVVSSSKAVKL